jgi:polysaccharide biosynthesis/export protein
MYNKIMNVKFNGEPRQHGLRGFNHPELLHSPAAQINHFSMITKGLSLFLCLLCLSIGSLKIHAKEPVDNSYILRSNDIIRLDVYEEPDLSGAVRILKTGHVSFPLIGSIEISGLTVNAAATKIRELYAKDYLVDPKLTLTIQEYSTDYIWVIGAVAQAGQIAIPLSGNIDLASAIATAGGILQTADANRILLVRESGETSTYSMSSISNGNNGRVKLQANDRIIVNQSAFVGKSVTILGRVARQGPVPFSVNGKLDLVAAIALAGGLTDLANPKKITINRKGNVTTVDYREISERGESPFILQPDDIVNVPERLF